MTTQYNLGNLCPAELRLRDVIKLYDGPFNTGVVTQIKNGSVFVFRPYATTTDFAYTGGVVPYVGMETVDLSLQSNARYTVIERHPVK